MEYVGGFITHILYVPILYVLTKKLASLFCGIGERITNDIFISGSLLLFCFVGKKYNLDLMGWNLFSISPHGYFVSFIFSIISFLLFLSTKIKSAICIQIISCLIHPVMSLLSIIFFFAFIPNLQVIKKFFPVIIAEIICLGCLSLIFKQESIDSALFFKIYIYDRHPHHYLISQCLNWKLFLIIDFLLILIAITSYKLCRKFFLSSVIFVSLYSMIPVVHYIFTERFHMLTFMELGITRSFHFTLYVLYISFIILSFALMKRYSINIKLHIQNNNMLSKCECFLNEKKNVINIIGFFVVIVIIIPYLHRETKYYNDSSITFNETYFEALSKIESPKDDVILVIGRDPVEFMLYSKLNLYYSDIFPFDTKLFYEFNNRRDLFIKFKEHLNINTLNNLKKYRVDYILINRDQLPEEFNNYVCLKTNNYVLLNIK